MTLENDLNRDVDVDLGGIFLSVWRNKGKLLIFSLIVTALVFVLLQSVSNRYQAETRILIRVTDPVLSTSGNGNPNAATELDDQGIASQVELLKSRTLAQSVVEKLELNAKREFGAGSGASTLDTLLYLIGLSEPAKLKTGSDRVMEAFQDRLSVYQAERARVVVVSFWSHDPKIAAAVPNAMADEYMALQDELKRGANPEELAKLEPELKALRQSVMEAEAAVAEFRSSSDLLDGTNNNTLASQELSELATELGKVRAQFSEAKANADAVSQALASGTLDNASSVVQSPLIQRLREREIALNGQLTDLSITLLPNHPRIKSVQSQLTALAGQIRSEARKIERALQDEVKIAEKRQEDLIAERNRLKAEVSRVDKALVDLRALEREADAKRQLLNQYLVRFQEATARQNRQFLPADAFIFSRASVPSEPYFPKKLPMLGGAFFGTFILGSMLAIAGSVLGGAATRAAQPPQQVRTPQYAGAGSNLLQGNGLTDDGQAQLRDARAREKALAAQSSVAAASARTPVPAPGLATSGSRAEQGNQPVEMPAIEDITTNAEIAAKSLSLLGPSRVAVLSPQAEAGSRGIVVLARELAKLKTSVVVVDMTGAGSSSRLMLRDTTVAGIKDVLAGTSSLADALHRDATSRAHIMPSGRAQAKTAAQHAQQLGPVLTLLKQVYDYVLIDCAGVDIGGLKRVSDEDTFNIVAATDSHSQEVRQACEMLLRGGLGAPLVVELEGHERTLGQFSAA